MIFYQHSNKQVAFAISTDVATQICAWCADNGMPEQFSKSITSMSGGKSLKFEFDVISDTVISLRVGGFAISCQAVELSTLEDRKQSWYLYNNRKDELIVFNIHEDVYPFLAKWKYWNATEALTPRYSYDFQLDCVAIDQYTEQISVYDRKTTGLFLIHWDEYEGEASYQEADPSRLLWTPDMRASGQF